MTKDIQTQEKYIGQENQLTSSFFGVVIVTGILVLANLGLIVALIQANFRQSTFVQLNDGTAVEVTEADVYTRRDEVIKETTKSFLTLLWEWNNKIPGSTDKDPGFEFTANNQKYKIPSTVYWASQLIEGSKSSALISEIVNQIPQNIFQTGESDIHIQYLSTPRQIGKDTYEIDVIATTSLRLSGQLDQKNTLKKTFVWQAVLPYLPLLGPENTSPLRRLSMNLRQSGLLLIEAKPFNP
jgi:type II secretory ATPase GspE/PulE/Tfp pilus assembly ATPase PilB-like protein